MTLALFPPEMLLLIADYHGGSQLMLVNQHWWGVTHYFRDSSVGRAPLLETFECE